MIITIAGTAGSGKSTVGKKLAKKLGYKHYSMGDFQRIIAGEKGISIIELGKLEEKDKSIDLLVDKKQKELGKKENNFVIDSRLGFHFIPKSIKIFIDADLKERARRIFADNNRKESYKSIEDTARGIRKREESEKKRYKRYYGVNHLDKDNYDLLIDSTNCSPDRILKIILQYLKQKKS